MINLKALFKRNGNLLTLNKEDVELLQYFMSHKQDFETWLAANKTDFPKTKFTFYYPSAVDLFYDEFKLFTIYYNKETDGSISFTQFKMTQVNAGSLNTRNWKPFKDIILAYLSMAEQRSTDLMFKKQKSLHEYQVLCKEEEVQREYNNSPLIKKIFKPNVIVPGSSV